MREINITVELINNIKRIAQEEQATQVESVTVWFGARSNVQPEEFKVEFANNSTGTIIENAALVFEESDDIDHPEADEVLIKRIDIID